MVFTSDEQRWNIIYTWRAEAEDLSATARKMHLRLRDVKHWVSKYTASGNVEPEKKTGRKRALSEVVHMIYYFKTAWMVPTWWLCSYIRRVLLQL